MRDHLRRVDPLTRRQRQAVKRVDAARERFVRREQRFPTQDELAAELGWTAREVSGVRVLAASETVSMDEPRATTGDDGELTLHDMLEDSAAQRDLELVGDGEIWEQALSMLSERERLIIRLCYAQEWTLSDIGVLLDVSVSRVCQIRRDALEKLRKRLAPELLAA